MTNPFALRPMADAFDLMQRVRHVVGKSRRLQHPLVVRARTGNRQQAKRRQYFFVHNSTQNLMDTDRIANPYAIPVTTATGAWACAIPWTFSPLLRWS